MSGGGNQPAPWDGSEFPLWRAVAVFRVAALGYAAVLLGINFREYRHPGAGWAVLAVMVAWTALCIPAYARSRRPRWLLLAVDGAVTLACLLASRPVVGAEALSPPESVPVLTVSWMAGPVLAWAISEGRRLGMLAGLVVGVVDLVVRGEVTQRTVNATVLLLLAGVGVGHVARLGVQAQERLRRAAELEAATRERERWARTLHDTVLQVLAMLQRRGAELGGEAAELGRLAGEQEAALRRLVSVPGRRVAPPASGGGDDQPQAASYEHGPDGLDADDPRAVDLREELERYADARVTLAAPADPVPLPGPIATEVTAAVAAALDNVRRHAGPGARAWILVEDEQAEVIVTVRDDGRGIPDGRLAQAEAAGRLGVAHSIHSRIRALGGAVTVGSVPDQGTEVELRIPRPSVG